MRTHLASVSRSSFLTMLSLCFLVVVAAVLSYAIAPKFKAYRSVMQSYAVLGSVVTTNNFLQQDLQSLKQDISELEKNLNGDSSSLPFKQFESHIIGRLQDMAWKYNIVLSGVQPKKGKKIDQFREMLFRVTLRGNYFDIYDLLSDFQNGLGFVVVKKFNLTPYKGRDKDSSLRVQMTIASYRTDK
ncbi:MAG: type 4a pilus biogenesis protein PilO [Pseudomonadales bacterium]